MYTYALRITHTIFAHVQLSKFGEVGNVGGDTYQVIFTKTQFSKIGQPEKFLQEKQTCKHAFVFICKCRYEHDYNAHACTCTILHVM